MCPLVTWGMFVGTYPDTCSTNTAPAASLNAHEQIAEMRAKL